MCRSCAAALAATGAQQAAGLVEELATVFDLFALGSDPASRRTRWTVAIRFIPYVPGANLNRRAELLKDSLPPGFVLVDTEDVDVPNYPARRLVFTSEDQETGVLGHVLRNGERFWILMFAAPSSSFDELLPVFDQSVLTFRVVG